MATAGLDVLTSLALVTAGLDVLASLALATAGSDVLTVDQFLFVLFVNACVCDLLPHGLFIDCRCQSIINYMHECDELIFSAQVTRINVMN